MSEYPIISHPRCTAFDLFFLDWFGCMCVRVAPPAGHIESFNHSANGIGEQMEHGDSVIKKRNGGSKNQTNEVELKSLNELMSLISRILVIKSLMSRIIRNTKLSVILWDVEIIEDMICDVEMYSEQGFSFN